jgi:outer membrane murein-binding lipoprotein Lpp
MKRLITSLCALGLLTVPLLAAADNQDTAKLDQVSTETQTLKKQLAELQQDVAALKQIKHRKQIKKHIITPAATTKGKVTTTTIEADEGTDFDRLIEVYAESMPVDWDNPGQSFVSIGPYVNVPIQFSGNNLIINDPKINTDVALLKLKKLVHKGIHAKGIHTEEETHHSHLLLSGNIEGQAKYMQFGQQGGNGGTGNNGSSSNINLSSAELDGFLLTPSPWVSGFFSFTYEDGANRTISNSRVLNSNLSLNTAFITFGDFERSSYYSSLGQMFVPFGTYSSVFISAPLTKKLARTKARAWLVGYQGQEESALYTSAYAFSGDTHASATSRVNNGGINFGYRFDMAKPDLNGDIGIGWIGNIADSSSMQYTGAQPQFNGFGGPLPFGNEKMVHRVPAFDVHGKISYREHLDFIAEYVGATSAFSPNDLTFNAHGAKPWAVNTEAAYTFSAFNFPTSVGIGYGQAKEALALGLPERRIGAVINTSFWHNTIQSLEFRHDINYSSSTVASGSNVPTQTPGLGTYDNVVTLQFDLFF